MKNIAMLGSGFIGRFYAEAIQGPRKKDKIISVYSGQEENARSFAKDFNLKHWTTDLKACINHPDVDVVCIALPNHLHEEAVLACCQAGKAVLCTKPLGRNGTEAKRMLDAVEQAGIFNGYLEDLVYTPKFLKALNYVKSGAIGKVLWTKSRETHPGPHSHWFWDLGKSGGGCMLDLGCHCIEIGRSYIGKTLKPVEVMCWADTQVKPIEAEDHAIGLVKFENGAIAQFECSWSFRGGLDLRDEVMGTEGTAWVNTFLRTGLEVFTSGEGTDYVSEKAESSSGWLFPVGDEVNELGYNHMFADMFDAMDNHRSPIETFYDGYIVNAIIDAAYLSAKSKKWETIHLDDWRGETGVEKISAYKNYDEDYYLLTEEVTHYGAKKLVLKHKETGEVIQKEIG